MAVTDYKRIKSVKSGLYTPGVESEVADFSSGDHRFTHLPKLLWVEVPAAGGRLDMKLPNDAGDLSITVAVNGYHPWSPTHIRQTSTVSRVVGMID